MTKTVRHWPMPFWTAKVKFVTDMDQPKIKLNYYMKEWAYRMSSFVPTRMMGTSGRWCLSDINIRILENSFLLKYYACLYSTIQFAVGWSDFHFLRFSKMYTLLSITVTILLWVQFQKICKIFRAPAHSRIERAANFSFQKITETLKIYIIE